MNTIYVLNIEGWYPSQYNPSSTDYATRYCSTKLRKHIIYDIVYHIVRMNISFYVTVCFKRMSVDNECYLEGNKILIKYKYFVTDYLNL